MQMMITSPWSLKQISWNYIIIKKIVVRWTECILLVYQLLESINEDAFHVFNNLNYLPTDKPGRTNNSLFVHAFCEAFIKMLIRKPLLHFLFGQESYISQFGT